MRFVNLGRVPVAKHIWLELAKSMGLAGMLPGSVAHDPGMYDSCRTLRVKVYPPRSVQKGKMVTTGTYSYGRIRLSPCTHCTGAFLTQVYLHELAHAWLHQYHPSLYDAWPSCEFAERFATAGYKALGGGKARKVELCGSYSFPTRLTPARLHDFKLLAKSLTDAKPEQIMRWHPGIRKAKDIRSHRDRSLA